MGKWASGKWGEWGEWASGRVGEWASGRVASGRVGEWASGRVGRVGGVGEWASGRVGEWGECGHLKGKSCPGLVKNDLPVHSLCSGHPCPLAPLARSALAYLPHLPPSYCHFRPGRVTFPTLLKPPWRQRRLHAYAGCFQANARNPDT